MLALHVKGQIIGRKRSAQGHKVYFELSKRYVPDMSYRDRLVKLSLLPLEYRRKVKDLEIMLEQAILAWVTNTFFYQTVVWQKTRNSSE